MRKTSSIIIWVAVGACAVAASILFAVSVRPEEQPVRPEEQPAVNDRTDETPANETSTTDDDDTTPEDRSGDAPLYMTTMTHMEGIFQDDKNQTLFDKHVDGLRFAMDLFDEYGAKITVETERSFAQANVNWDLNFLKEVVDRGHGVGTHCDYGYTPNGRGTAPDVEEVTNYLKDLRTLIDDLVGTQNNQGNSGCIGEADWVIASANAGYTFKSGVTGIAYLSMPQSERPEGWTDEYIYEEGYHEGIPPEFEEAIYPIPLKDANDLEPDADPLIVVMGGELGELASLSEGRSNCFPNCAFTQDDVDVVLEAIEKADQIRDRSRVAKINIHIPAVLFSKNNEALLRELLAGIQEYVEQGKVVWTTQLEAYQGYVEWEQ